MIKHFVRFNEFVQESVWLLYRSMLRKSPIFVEEFNHYNLLQRRHAICRLGVGVISDPFKGNTLQRMCGVHEINQDTAKFLLANIKVFPFYSIMRFPYIHQI